MIPRKLLITLVTVLALITSGVAEEWEPEPENHDVLLKALLAIQKSDIRTHFDEKEGTSIYYRSICHLGRVETHAGTQHFFRLHRIRSGNLITQSPTPPPRGEYILAWFDDEIRLLGSRWNAGDAQLDGTVLQLEGMTFDLSLEREYKRATMQEAEQ